MKHKVLQQERGQILVILVLALVGLLAFTALAIDVGMVFSDRRYDQNVADSVALAGSAAASKTMISAYRSNPEEMQGSTEKLVCPVDFDYTTYIPPESNWQAQWTKVAMHDAYLAARTRGTTNHFTLEAVSEADFSTVDEGILIKCVDEGHLNAEYKQVGFYTKAKVSSTTESTFAHFIFGEPLRNTVSAVALSQPFIASFGGYAMISMDTESCGNGSNQGGIWFDGTGTVVIHDGGALADTCMAKNGSTGSINLEGGGEAEYNTGSQDCTQFFDVVDSNGDGVFEQQTATCTSQADAPVDRVELPVPDCNSLPTFNTTNLSPTAIMEPGHYVNAVSINGSDFNVTMKPGFYCFDNGFTATANGASPNASLTGEGVTIYMNNGLFSMTGQANFQLSAPYYGSATYEEAMAHDAMAGYLLIYRYSQTTPECQDANISDVKMEGNSLARYTGTIYAPCSQVDFGGTSDLVNSTAQIIGNTIKIHGSPTSDLYYDASVMGLLSPVADLIQ